TRLRLLIKFFVSQANRGYLNGLATEMGESTNAIRKELNHLHDAGYLQKEKSNNKIQYKANTGHPMFAVLQKVILKHLGLEDAVEIVLERMGDVEQIILIGDYAKGIDSGKIEIIIVGQDLNTSYVQNLEEKLEKLISRKVAFFLSANHRLNADEIILFNKNE
ncbi:ArsR family transcriptional regulator, partial [Flavobacteriaceae bacterium]|nr:ArsR family transcriptional regulator [Flavobacteriaceae bacterium]